jgi:hypothetical protein
MSILEIVQHIDRSTPTELAARVAVDLDSPSPRIGAKGPPDRPGPEEDYVVAVEQLQDEDAAASLDKLGRAINSLLLDEVKAIQLTGRMARPLLLFNVCALLETVALPVVSQGLRDLRQSAEPLAAALREQGENVYSRLLLAHSVNQAKTSDDEQFWLGLLSDPDPLKVAGGVVGIRECGFETAMKYLPLVEKKHWEHREVLGEFSGEIMLLVDTYADRHWPECAEPFYPAYHESRIRELIEDYAARRYTPEDDELHQVAGSSVAAFATADGDDQLAALADGTPLQIKEQVSDLWRDNSTRPIAERDRDAFRLICVAAHRWSQARDAESRDQWLDALCYALRPAAQQWLKRFDRALDYAWQRIRQRHLDPQADVQALAGELVNYCKSGLSHRLRQRLTQVLGSAGSPPPAPQVLSQQFDSRVAFSAVVREAG